MCLETLIETHVKYLRKHHTKAEIQRAFEKALNIAPHVYNTPPPPPPPTVPKQTPQQMNATLVNYEATHQSEMSQTQLHWFDIMKQVTAGGKPLAGKQVTTINNISQRLTGVDIIT